MTRLNLPDNASDQDACLAGAKLDIINAKKVVADFDKALENGDTDALRRAVRDLPGTYKPITSQAAREAVDSRLQSAGIDHSWGKHGELSLIKDKGANVDIVNFDGLETTAMRLAKDEQGRITSADREQPDHALKAVLNDYEISREAKVLESKAEKFNKFSNVDFYDGNHITERQESFDMFHDLHSEASNFLKAHPGRAKVLNVILQADRCAAGRNLPKLTITDERISLDPPQKSSGPHGAKVYYDYDY
jgi:hypothetical protein